MSEGTLPSNTCHNCHGQNLFTTRVPSTTGRGSLLPGLGDFFYSAEFHVIVCADCGLTQFFAESSARKKLESRPEWRRIS